MSSLPDRAKSLDELIEYGIGHYQKHFQTTERPLVIVSPYRINPIGAHIDHQGGSVLARTIDQYTVLVFMPSQDNRVSLITGLDHAECSTATFVVGETQTPVNWVRYAMASAKVLDCDKPVACGLQGFVFGTMIGAGLSSSASVILSYLSGLAVANQRTLSSGKLVELCRQVEHNYMGLNNGIQDQMSIVYGQPQSLSLLDMASAAARQIPDHTNCNATQWMLCYSGFSRELVASNFNARVAECRHAAVMLDADAAHLGQVSVDYRSPERIAALTPILARRATHVYTEMDRVAQGAAAWAEGNWQHFGQLMNASCRSSMTQYESGTQAMIDLQDIASHLPSVVGSRFGGGGFGGCLILLVQAGQAEDIGVELLAQYIARFPDRDGIARALVAHAEQHVRLL